jgi:hypothetical protein
VEEGAVVTGPEHYQRAEVELHAADLEPEAVRTHLQAALVHATLAAASAAATAAARHPGDMAGWVEVGAVMPLHHD